MAKKTHIQLWIISFSVLLIGVGIFYTFFWKPFYKEHRFNTCLSRAEEELTSKNSGLNAEITELNKQVEVALKDGEKELEVFLKENPEPIIRKGGPVITTYDKIFGASNKEDLEKHSAWFTQKNDIFKVKNELETKRNALHKQVEENEKTQETEEAECYKLYR